MKSSEYPNLFGLVWEGVSTDNEKAVISYCRFILKLTPEDRKNHRECISNLCALIKGNSGEPELTCYCKYCRGFYPYALRAQQHLRESLQMMRLASAKKVKKPTNIYIILNNRNGMIKIGRSLCPLNRESTLQSEDPDVSLLHHFVATEDHERYLHQRYAEWRVRGEWFKLTRAQIEEIAVTVKKVANQ